MPTTKPRHQVTETPDVARALDRAAMRWPGEPRSKLLLRLLQAGDQALQADRLTATEQHRAAVRASAGAYPEAFDADYLADMREDWPA